MDEHVWLIHPGTGGQWQCPAAAVDDWLERGWKRAGEPPEEPNPVVPQQTSAAPAAVQTDTTTAGGGTGEMSDG
ncbi:hypothetical protein [Micromonospora robiginosa]|uniref:Uncharacterized protein n=1 Tax=Micromonospora robiginosa TaxID=2749844 RepID=A0A7L6B7N8_9ACTN|nr:hypothetical protein [Micromonospora ferruginea]QLQ37992.1 hypothetical protein H1D33_03610 [Micromonospora ferruginea]